jgi:hypothetical protein
LSEQNKQEAIIIHLEQKKQSLDKQIELQSVPAEGLLVNCDANMLGTPSLVVEPSAWSILSVLSLSIML